MSFSIQLTPDLLPVEPGATTPVSVAVTNRSDEADQFEMEVEGIDSEWKAIPVPMFPVDANESHSEKIFFKPLRTSESLAGNYPFVIRVRSLISGESKTAQGVLQIRPYNHLTMEVSPKKGFVSPGRKHNIFDVAVVNLGNTEHTLHLVGSDPEDACTYEFEHEQVTVSPGQQKEVELTVNPRNEPIFSGGRLIGFTVTGRSIDPPSAVTSSQAQLEQRSLLSPATVIVFFLLAALAGAWYLMRPKPPVLSMNVDPVQVMQGDTVTVKWAAQQATRITIRDGDETIYDGSDLSGTKTFVPDASGTLTIYGVAEKDGKRDEQTRQLEVTAKPITPKPQILSLSAEPNRVRLGEVFILKYSFNSAVKRAVMSPLGVELDPTLNELQITPTMAGTQEYTVVASNEKGETARKAIKVNVVDESDARISVLRATPPVVEEPATRVSIDWLVTNSVQVELTVNGQTSRVGATGPMDFTLTAKTEFVITAYDNKGRTVHRKLTVDYKKAPPPPVDPPIEEGTETSTSGGTDAGGAAGGV
jgi:hypothetical protein